MRLVECLAQADTGQQVIHWIVLTHGVARAIGGDAAQTGFRGDLHEMAEQRDAVGQAVVLELDVDARGTERHGIVLRTLLGRTALPRQEQPCQCPLAPDGE